MSRKIRNRSRTMSLVTKWENKLIKKLYRKNSTPALPSELQVVSNMISHWNGLTNTNVRKISFRYYQSHYQNHHRPPSFREYLKIYGFIVPCNDTHNNTNWKEVISKDGTTYFWNTDTNKTQYDIPDNYEKLPPFLQI